LHLTETNKTVIYFGGVTPSGFQLHEPRTIRERICCPLLCWGSSQNIPQGPHGSGDLPACPRRGAPRAAGCQDPEVLASLLGCCWHCLGPSLPPVTPLQTLAWRPSPGTCWDGQPRHSVRVQRRGAVFPRRRRRRRRKGVWGGWECWQSSMGKTAGPQTFPPLPPHRHGQA